MVLGFEFRLQGQGVRVLRVPSTLNPKPWVSAKLEAEPRRKKLTVLPLGCLEVGKAEEP